MIEYGGINFENLKQMQQNFALDYNLQDLQSGTPEEKIRKIAQHFESMLLETLLKAMEVKDENKEAMPGSGSYSDLRLMFLNQHLINNGGLGYWKLIEEQLKEKYQQTIVPNPEASFKLAGQEKKQNSFNLVAPVEGEVSSFYGLRSDPFKTELLSFHKGVDLAVKEGTPIRSVSEGKVVFSGWKDNYGYMVEIAHGNGLKSVYAHNKMVLVDKGQVVKSGEIISLSGNSGRSTGPHLHFELHENGEPVNPLKYFPQLAAKGSLKTAERYNGKP